LILIFDFTGINAVYSSLRVVEKRYFIVELNIEWVKVRLWVLRDVGKFKQWTHELLNKDDKSTFSLKLKLISLLVKNNLSSGYGHCMRF
jgi:hypothetical protein